MKTRVVTIAPDATLGQAVDLMDVYQVDALPVVDSEGRLLGILTDDDLLRMLCTPIDEVEYTSADWYHCARMRSVSEYQTVPQVTVDEFTDAREITRLMVTHEVKCLPVLTTEGRFAGLVSCLDVIQAAFESPSTSDASRS